VDFFIGPHYLVTVHDGRSRSIAELQENVSRNAKMLSEDRSRCSTGRGLDGRSLPSGSEQARGSDRRDREGGLRASQPGPLRRILDTKRDVSSLRRIISPQRDVIARLARRGLRRYQHRPVIPLPRRSDHIVRIVDDSTMFQDRISGILDAHLTNVSNRLNEVMKVLTVVSTIFMPLTLLSGLWGMNIRLPMFPGGDAAQFWWLSGVMGVIVLLMLTLFRRKNWI
jgi:magnesium transporter